MVQARIHTLGGFSAHASKAQLIDWLSQFKGDKPRLFLVHGEDKAKHRLQESVKQLGWNATIPKLGEKITL